MIYLMGSALEHYWGTFRFNAFLGLGWILTVSVAFLTPASYATNLLFLLSVFLAFAFLNPEFVIVLFFILPVKIKWMALLLWILYGLTLVFGEWSARLAVLAATGNFLVFFAGDIVNQIRTGRRRMAHQAKVFAESTDEREPRHRCRVCGKTDLVDPKLDFRYCSKCAGNQCYCPEHIFNHEHVLVDEDAKK
jgi:Pyruvate/2-oxoacid:ferredoxin oxidoreductase delta subunit